MHNDASAFGTDLVRDGPWSGVQYESRVSLRVVYTVASVCICHISRSEGECGKWRWW